METNNNPVESRPAPEPRKPLAGKLWVVVVLLLGLVIGIILSDLATLPQRQRGFPLLGIPEFNPDPGIRLHIILTTVEVTLLVSLVLVYLKIYAETKAHFAAGLVVVLSALFLQTVFSYPLILGTGQVILIPGILTLAADVLTVSAYTVFLYLSLE